MRNRTIPVIILAAALSCANPFLACAQQAIPKTPNAPALQTKTADVNRDGRPDVVCYSDGKNVIKVEADTNYDGKPDVTVYAENGKFKSAEADTDYDGKPEKKFNDVREFNQWLNQDNPKFKDSLGWRDDGTYTMFLF